MRPNDDGWIAQAAGILSVGLRYHTTGQAQGPCPRCGGEDRFVVFVEGNSYCRRCKLKRWWDRPDDVRERAAEELLIRHNLQLAMREQMATVEDWQVYHQSLIDRPDCMWLWELEGMLRSDVDRWGLGFCDSCPLAPGRASLTIPVFTGNRLVDIRHRLVDGEQGDKYRSHLAGLVPAPFNLGGLATSEHVVIVEGEKKSIHMVRGGFPATVGLPGTSIYRELIVELGASGPDRDVTIMLDPGADGAAQNIARAILPLGIRVFIADSFGKPDDLLLEHGPSVVRTILAQARSFGPGRTRLAKWADAL